MGFEGAGAAGLLDGVAGAVKGALGGGAVAGEALDFEVVFFRPVDGIGVLVVDRSLALVVLAGFAPQEPFAAGGLFEHGGEGGIVGRVVVEPSLTESVPFFFFFAGEDEFFRAAAVAEAVHAGAGFSFRRIGHCFLCMRIARGALRCRRGMGGSG